MALFDKELQKLEIVAYANNKMPQKPLGSVTATFNPDSISFSYSADYEPVVPLDQSKAFPTFRHLNNGTLSLKLRFDAMQKGEKVSVSQQVIHLNQLCASVDNAAGETNYLEVKWGKLSWNEMDAFLWRMNSMSTTYMLFERDGKPLRAEVDLELTPCPRETKASGKGGKGVSKLINDKDSLPAIAALDGKQADYLDLATNNKQLNSLNGLDAGSLLKSPRRFSL